MIRLIFCLFIWMQQALAFTLPTWNGLGELLARRTDRTSIHLQKRAVNKTVWVSAFAYEGSSFFDHWDFYTWPDPTNGLVHYVDRDTAFRDGLAYVTEDGRANMHVDNRTTLMLEEVLNKTKLRSSVRIHSKAKYNHGLFLLDVAKAPWGCAAWPAYWTTADESWPANGEIDIIEEVHSASSNQVAFHTNPGCKLTTPGNFSGLAGSTDCDGTINHNIGCGIVDSSVASFGEQFNAKGGGVYAMKWDSDSIDVWFFYRSAIPSDILEGLPNPASWRLPSASLSNQGCNKDSYFRDQKLIFDTTLCGDWAGTSYSHNNCPGTCEEQVTKPENFVNATWSINSIKVYNKTVISTWYLEGEAIKNRFPLFTVLFATLCMLLSISL